jgi:hypothetical protein
MAQQPTIDSHGRERAAPARSKTKRAAPAAGVIAATVLALGGVSAGLSGAIPAAGVAATSAAAKSMLPPSRPGDAPAVYPAPPAEPCPVDGDRGDPLLNDQKNRYRLPADADIDPTIKVPGDIISLDVPPTLHGARAGWSGPDAAAVAARERKAVIVEGFIVDLIEENKGNGEACNCHRPKELYDYHVFLAEAPADDPKKPDKTEAVVVEMTPRWRFIRPSWAPASNVKSHANKDRVRITGWLLLDEDHLDMVGKARATAWEIHPVTKVEVLGSDGTWTAL